jgi:hypothetical protein
MTVRRIQIRRSTEQEWNANSNVVLRVGEFGLNITNKRLKIGDGVTPWSQLPYLDKTATQLDIDGGFYT